MKQVPAIEPPLTKMLDWLNTHTASRITPVQSLSQLSDGTAFLFLISRLDHTAINERQIIINPTTAAGRSSNRTLLTTTLCKMELSLGVKVFVSQCQICKLASTSCEQIRHLLTSLYSILGEKSIVKAQTNVQEQRSIVGQHMIQPSTQCSLNAEKKSKQIITDNELTELHLPLRNLKDIEGVADAQMKIQSQIQPKNSIFSGQSLFIQKEQLKPNLDAKLKIQMKNVLFQFTSQQTEYLIRPIDQAQSKLNDSIKSMQTGACLTQRSSKKSFKIQYEKRSIVSLLSGLTEKILRYISSKVQFSQEQQTIINNFSQVASSEHGFNYLFFGKKLSGRAIILKNFQEQKEMSFQEARKDIRRYCERYYKSSLFIKRLFSSFNSIMRNKICILHYLPKIEQLPYKETSLFQFLSTAQAYKRLNQNQTAHFAVGSLVIVAKTKLQKKDILEEEICNQDAINETLEYLERRVIKEYWSKNRIVLIAFELKHVYNKKPDLKDQQAYNTFIGDKSRGRAEFDGGFYFPGRKDRVSVDLIKMIAENKYSHLNALFREAKEESAPQNVKRLRQFVWIMLGIKHHHLVEEFLEIYDTIVKEVRKSEYNSIRKLDDCFKIIETIINKTEKGVSSINDYFITTYNMEDDSAEIRKLIRVTIYCFLSEFHSITENEYYSEAFDFPKVDKKITIRKTFHKLMIKRLQKQ